MIEAFLQSVATAYKSGVAGEHSYRPALERLFNGLAENVSAINEPKRVDVGAPDFVFQRGDIVIGHCEAKDLNVDLNKMKGANADQKKRYTGGLSNLIYTNCLDWLFYRDGEQVGEMITIADFVMGIQPNPDRFAALEQRLREFVDQRPQTITSSKRLAERMAGKAILIKDILGNALMKDKDHHTELYGQYEAFKTHLIHDISINDFADLYAETVAYGMFAARLHDTTLNDFSRQEAMELLPKSNPFLKNLFGFIAGPNLDDRISWVIDDLADVFQATNVAALMEKFGSTTQRNDPFLHFYETFLAAYNPKKRKARGVWYTPEPVVNFIVRAVDDVLKTEFGLKDGLADTSKVTVEWDTGQRGLTKAGKPTKSTETVKTTREVHRVQILDPATGTGTFLAEPIKQIAPRVKAAAPAMWSSYVENDLIPRLHGFELLMASYAMCHLKLDMILTELDYQPSKSPPRLSVYLTNLLEEGDPPNQELPFARWLSDEVKAANAIKRDMPIMCVIGNPPYSGESANKGEWIMSLMEAYKKEPGGVKKLNERNPKWINDDYVKFIRFSEYMIEKNGEGVLGFITNHGYLDNPTFRGMRWHLLKTFDKIYVMDLHGNSKKKEVSPDGSPDKNVFDIQQGVAILIAVKTTPTVKGDLRKNGSDIPLAEVYHTEIWGDRKRKYESLWRGVIGSSSWKRLNVESPRFFLKDWSHELEKRYVTGFSIFELMPVNSVGVVTGKDSTFISNSEEELMKQIVENLGNFDPKYVTQVSYRPFQRSWIYYSANDLERSRYNVMRHYAGRKNLGLLVPKANRDEKFAHVFVTDKLNEAIFLSGTTASNAMNCPLYLYPDENDLDQTRRVNFDPKLYKKLREMAGVRPSSPVHGGGVEAEGRDGGGVGRGRRLPSPASRALPPQAGEEKRNSQMQGSFAGAGPGEQANEIDVFDYIYGVLHCLAYRETYAEFLKIDFPRVPWPKSPEVFWAVREKGEALRRLHLMEDDAVGEARYPFEGEGDNIVEKPDFQGGRVYINKDQYFSGVPEIAWNFYIGGYQPAQKWLKDRKGRALGFDDVRHCQKTVKILSETDRIMKTIEMPL